MKTSNLLTLISLVLCSFGALSQNAIPDDFPVRVLQEDFDSQNSLWQYPTSYDNLFVLENGSYYLTRLNAKSSYAIMTKWENNLRYFNVESAMLLGPGETKEQAVGIMFLIQNEGKGAVVFEFNNDKEFRVKKLVGAYYQYVSGDKNSSGWVKNKTIDPKQYNKLEVRASGRQCDFYINGDFVFSFDIPEDYGPGRVGIIVGPSTKAKVDNFYVGTNTDGAENLAAPVKVKTPEERLAELSQENLELKKKLADINVDQIKAESDYTVKLLENRLEEANTSIELLQVENTQLKQYKNNILQDMDEDAYITLSKSLKEEIKKNQTLTAKNTELRDSVIKISNELSEMKLKMLSQAIKDKEAENKKKAKEPAQPEPAKVNAPKQEVAKTEPAKKEEKNTPSVVDVLNNVKKLDEPGTIVGNDKAKETPAKKVDVKKEEPVVTKKAEEHEVQPTMEASKSVAKPEAFKVRKATKQ